MYMVLITGPYTYGPTYMGGRATWPVAKDGYTSITVPDDIVDRIEHFLKHNSWGFKTRPEVVKAALSEFLMQRGRGIEAEVCVECGGGLAAVDDGKSLWRGIVHRPACPLLATLEPRKVDPVVDAAATKRQGRR